MSRLGPLREREFRLLFIGQTTSRLGSAMAPVALAFAILNTLGGSATDIGIVLAVRQVAVIVLLLFGGVWSDRLPRHHVMVSSNVVSGASQAGVATLLLTGHARLWELAALAALNGASSAFFFPASTGIIPQTVPATMLQQANATLRLAINSPNIGRRRRGGRRRGGDARHLRRAAVLTIGATALVLLSRDVRTLDRLVPAPEAG